jgi:hypothetical protein
MMAGASGQTANGAKPKEQQLVAPEGWSIATTSEGCKLSVSLQGRALKGPSVIMGL